MSAAPAIEEFLLLVGRVFKRATGGDIASLRGADAGGFQLGRRRAKNRFRGFKLIEQPEHADGSDARSHDQREPMQNFFLGDDSSGHVQ